MFNNVKQFLWDRQNAKYLIKIRMPHRLRGGSSLHFLTFDYIYKSDLEIVQFQIMILTCNVATSKTHH